jgi:hypothetical protein
MTGLTILPPYPNSGSTNPDRNRNIFAEMVKVLDFAPGWQRIASNFGQSGTGLMATGQSNPAGERAYVVYRNVSGSIPCDITIIWTWNLFYQAGQFFGGSSNWGVGLSVAFHSSSQAWNGTQNNNGTDSFPSGQPWKSGSLVFPRQNASGGSYQTEGNRQYMGLFSLSLAQGNMVSAVDNDNIFFAYNDDNISQSSGTHETVFYFGRYVPESGSGIEFPYVYYASQTLNTQFQTLTTFGQTTDTNFSNHGISFVSTSIPNVSAFEFTYDLTLQSRENSLINSTGSVITEYPIYLRLTENIPTGSLITQTIGTIGRLDFIRAIRSSDLRNLDRLNNDSTLVLSVSNGGAGLPATFISIPWISGTLMPTGSSLSKTTNFLLPNTGVFNVPTPVYRSLVGGQYVYSDGAPEPNYTLTSIVGYK